MFFVCLTSDFVQCKAVVAVVKGKTGLFKLNFVMGQYGILFHQIRMLWILVQKFVIYQ